MKPIFTFLTFIAVCVINIRAGAQCPVIDCPEDVTLYLPADNCSVTYEYEAPGITDFCYSSTSFTFTGETQYWIVPAGVSEIKINAWGASGGHGSGPEYEINMGGKGAFVTGVIQVNEGDTLYINVGEKGQDAQIAAPAQGGWNGGGVGGFDADYANSGAGGGGGATDIRIGGNNLEHRVMVAGAGGGAAKNAVGGAGGTDYGITGTSFGVGEPGLGGGPDAGGAVFNTDRGATAGSFGFGGNGSTNHSSWGGGGGGAGYYGGSGGTAVADHNDGHAGSGGGGSSYISNAAEANMIADQRIGNGLAVIYYSNTEELKAELVDGPESAAQLSAGVTTYTFAAAGAIDTSYCSVQVTVLDTIAPVVITKNISIFLNTGQTADISPEQVNDGSFDNCSVAEKSLNILQLSGDFNGDTTVVMTVTDPSGNSSSAEAVISVTRQPQEMVQRFELNYGDNQDNNEDPVLYERRNFSVEDISTGAEMQIFPNPTTSGNADIIVALSRQWEFAMLHIWSSTGQAVLSKMVPAVMSSNSLRTSVEGLSPGIYLVQLSTETETATKRLIVK